MSSVGYLWWLFLAVVVLQFLRIIADLFFSSVKMAMWIKALIEFFALQAKNKQLIWLGQCQQPINWPQNQQWWPTFEWVCCWLVAFVWVLWQCTYRQSHRPEVREILHHLVRSLSLPFSMNCTIRVVFFTFNPFYCTEDNTGFPSQIGTLLSVHLTWV